MATKNTPTNVQFLTGEEYDAQMAEMDATFLALSEKNKTLTVPTKDTPLSRKRVVRAFTDCFEMIGGVPRLALWANENPGDFYKLYGKLLPSQTAAMLEENNEQVIKHVIPRTKLDE